ncbi:MAG: hypothetical protein EZS28_000596 [Streblomastix strix]|uniref:Uncharacterized protein n=1 Tax=Streblomastix strix TaxID=222440 RepID=A0A5J4XAE3_9EUKA|nr:MAG: hypothetical protein EZS28_000596 [Streblomastix strix]
MVQTCQVNWTITIPANTFAIQLNETNIEDDDSNKRINFNGKVDSQAPVIKNLKQSAQKYYGKQADGFDNSDRLRFWLRFSTACGPFRQFQLIRDATALWGTSIYARENAAISSNSLSDLYSSNSVSVSPLESIISGKHHCGIFIDMPLFDIDAKCDTTPWHFKIHFDTTFSGDLDLNQLNSIFNSFPVITRNYASLFLQLWIQDYLQDLKVVWLNKQDAIQNKHLAYHMILPEKPDIVYLLKEPTADGRGPQNSISQINNAKFEKLEIQNICFNVENDEAIVNMIKNGFTETSCAMQSITSFSNIKSLFMTFIMPQHVVTQPFEALTHTVNGLIKTIRQPKRTISTTLVNATGLLDYLVTYIIAFNGMLVGVPLNFGFIALSTIGNKVYPDYHNVSGLK